MKKHKYKKNDKAIMKDGVTHVIKKIDKDNTVFIDLNEHSSCNDLLLAGYSSEWFSPLDDKAKNKLDTVYSMADISFINKKDDLFSAKFKTKNGTIGTFIAKFKEDNSYDIQILAHNGKDDFFESFVKSLYTLNGHELKKILVDSEKKVENKISSVLTEDTASDPDMVTKASAGGQR